MIAVMIRNAVRTSIRHFGVEERDISVVVRFTQFAKRVCDFHTRHVLPWLPPNVGLMPVVVVVSATTVLTGQNPTSYRLIVSADMTFPVPHRRRNI